MRDEFPQDAVGDSRLYRRFLERFGLWRKIVVVVPVLAAADFDDFRLDFLFAFGRFFDGVCEILQQDVLFADVLFGDGGCGRAVHFFQKFSHVQVVVFVGG